MKGPLLDGNEAGRWDATYCWCRCQFGKMTLENVREAVWECCSCIEMRLWSYLPTSKNASVWALQRRSTSHCLEQKKLYGFETYFLNCALSRDRRGIIKIKKDVLSRRTAEREEISKSVNTYMWGTIGPRRQWKMASYDWYLHCWRTWRQTSYR